MLTPKLAEMKQRVYDKGIRCSDFKVEGLLTDADVGIIPALTIFNWVSQKQIRIVDFKRWVKVQQHLAVTLEYEKGRYDT